MKFLTMNIAKQLFREFIFQFIVSLIWAYFATKDLLESEYTIFVYLKNFAACFFLTSWFSGQLLRVIKQQKVENSLSAVLRKLESVAENINSVYKDIKGYSVGGDSFCYVDVAIIGDNEMITVDHIGNYPLYDVTVRFRNLNNKDHDDCYDFNNFF